MSHAATQIRDWFLAACTGVSGLPTCIEGTPRQIASNTDSCYVRTTTESIARRSLHEPPLDERELTVLVTVLGNTFAEADAMSLLAEEAIAAKASFPGGKFEFLQREYEENTETDRYYVACTLTYVAVYTVARTDVETIEG